MRLPEEGAHGGSKTDRAIETGVSGRQRRLGRGGCANPSRRGRLPFGLFRLLRGALRHLASGGGSRSRGRRPALRPGSGGRGPACPADRRGDGGRLSRRRPRGAARPGAQRGGGRRLLRRRGGSRVPDARAPFGTLPHLRGAAGHLPHLRVRLVEGRRRVPPALRPEPPRGARRAAAGDFDRHRRPRPGRGCRRRARNRAGAGAGARDDHLRTPSSGPLSGPRSADQPFFCVGGIGIAGIAGSEAAPGARPTCGPVSTGPWITAPSSTRREGVWISAWRRAPAWTSTRSRA